MFLRACSRWPTSRLMTLNDYLWQRRMTATEFARALGIGTSHAWKLRNGRVEPKIDLANRIVVWTEGAVTLNDLSRAKETP